MSRKGLTQQVILQSAAEMIDQDGLDQLSLASLAQRLGVKTPSLYNHIDGLTGLLKQLALYGISKLRDTLLQASVGKSSENALLSIGFAYVSFVREHPGLYEATMPSSTIFDEEILEAGNDIVQLIGKVLEVYNLNQEDIIHAIRGLRSIVHGFATLEFKKGFNINISIDNSLEHLLKTYILGLKIRTGNSEKV